MPLKATALCRYPNFSGTNLRWREEDWGAYKWIQALKEKELRGDCHVPVNNQMLRLSDANRASSVEWFGFLAAQHLISENILGPVNSVSVPNSRCTVDSAEPSRTFSLARALALSLGNGSVAVDCLRWNVDWGAASERLGSRNRDALFSNLTLLDSALSNLIPGAPFILLDDMTTSGAHLLACATKLKNEGFQVIEAVCGGKTFYDQSRPAFEKYEESLDGFEP
jgi:predicted amidophosphoribosyltransferase